MTQEQGNDLVFQETLGRIFRSMSEIARMRNERPDDYVDEEGFVRCAKCHGRKQRIIDSKAVGLGAVKVWTMCPCLTEEAREREKNEREEAEREARRSARRELAESLRREYKNSEQILTASFDIFFTEVFTGEFDNPQSRRIYRIATRYVEFFDKFLRENKGLLFLGDTGTGKTFTAACIANALYSQGVPVVITSLTKLIDSIDFRDSSKSASAIIERINQADLLVLDDIGVERATPTAMEKTYEFINGRYEANKPMILTSNLTVDELAKTQSLELRRVYGRITEFCHLVAFRGPNLRKKRAAELFASMTEILEGD